MTAPSKPTSAAKQEAAVPVPDEPAATELDHTWGRVLNGPIRYGDGMAIAAAEVTPVRPGRPTQLLADYLTDHDTDAAVRALHASIDLGTADAPWARERIEVEYNAPARFEDERANGTMLEATFVAVHGSPDRLTSTLFLVSDLNGSAGLAFGQPRPDDAEAERIATAFWARLVALDSPLADYTDHATVRAAGGPVNFGVQDGQPFVDEESGFSDEMDLTDVVSRRAIAMTVDGGDDEAVEDDLDEDDANGAGDSDGFDDYDRDGDGKEDGDVADDVSEAASDGNAGDNETDLDGDDPGIDDSERRPGIDEDFLSMLLDDDD